VPAQAVDATLARSLLAAFINAHKQLFLRRPNKPHWAGKFSTLLQYQTIWFLGKRGFLGRSYSSEAHARQTTSYRASKIDPRPFFFTDELRKSALEFI
jgi:hypothetical protein